MRTIITFIFIFSFALMNAQDYDSNYVEKKVRFNGLYLGTGLLMTRSIKMDKNKLETSWSEFKNRPYSNYSESDYSSSGFTGNTYYEAGASFYTNWGKRDSLFNRWQLRIGLCYSSQSTISSFEDYKSRRIDTLIGTSTVSKFYMDNVEYNSAYVTHTSDLLGINLSEMFTPANNDLLSLTGGFGLSAMFGVNSYITESMGTWTVNYVTEDPNYDYSANRPDVQVNNSIASSVKVYKSGAMYSLFAAYLAAGVNVRWITGKNGFRIILNPMVTAGVKNFNVSKGGSYFSSFAVPQVSLRIMFR